MGEGMTDAIAAELRELTQAATTGPWEWATDEGAPVYVQLYCADEGVTEYETVALSSDERRVRISDANARLIAAMRNALPALLDERERLRSALREAVACFYEPCHPGRPALKAIAWRETVEAWGRVLETGHFGKGPGDD